MAQFYKSFRQNLSNAESVNKHAWPEASGYVYKLMLVTSGYTFSENHQYASDITSEVAGAGYSASGKILTNKLLLAIGSNPTLYGWDADNPIWVAANGFTAAGAVLYRSTGVPSANPLVCFLDGGTSPDNFPKTAIGTDLEFLISPSGFITV